MRIFRLLIVYPLLLAGVAINTVAGSLIGLLTYMASDSQLRDLTFWSMGSLAGANWRLLAFLGPWTLICSLWLLTQWRVMNALLLGEREAGHLGYALTAVRRKLIVATALIVGPLVAATGGTAQARTEITPYLEVAQVAAVVHDDEAARACGGDDVRGVCGEFRELFGQSERRRKSGSELPQPIGFCGIPQRFNQGVGFGQGGKRNWL